jgi:hypothetical protein
LVVLTAVYLAMKPDAATAKDLAAVASFVTPAYTAMNLATACAGVSGWVASQPRGPRGVAVQYAQHVKDEAISFLTLDEASTVLRMAADAARSSARERFARLNVSGMPADTVQIAAWCNGDVRDFIIAFIQEHDEDHDGRLQQLGDAKR